MKLSSAIGSFSEKSASLKIFCFCIIATISSLISFSFSSLSSLEIILPLLLVILINPQMLQIFSFSLCAFYYEQSTSLYLTSLQTLLVFCFQTASRVLCFPLSSSGWAFSFSILLPHQHLELQEVAFLTL